jgi:glycolate oxidase iron-sulfur subunit
MIDLFPPNEFDAIISNAAGCGSHLKHYHGLLKDDEKYAGLAKEWDAKLKDVHEWLVEIGMREPSDTALGQTQKVTYHEACHLCHGQKITAQPRQILRAIPGLELAELPESTWCCGSAGIYNITQPEMANKLLDRKVGHIRSTGAEVVAMGNPGCSLHITNGLAKCQSNIRVAHPITLLAEAYRREKE